MGNSVLFESHILRHASTCNIIFVIAAVIHVHTKHCIVFHRIVECLSVLLKIKGRADPPVTIRWAKTEINK
jgi:hypothetical protein